ncbi:MULTISPECIES: hypothetical protein [Microbacterium]|uniref:hypothetical protein n=1 Tax=Microbacterium TaxID=33882 RepID=UPI002786C670|nr:MULTISPECIES: hypothetical protein [Microbacterium]MDQ1076131.1 hypothetical protein [Microbacterium sp. SORGH_AS_0969]MDQ1116370.1 hypothetical protein [Microbacterium testaceum]
MSDRLTVARARTGRVIFDTFRSHYDPRLAAWLLLRSHFLPELAAAHLEAQAATPSESIVSLGVFGVWRLLATNNRELARCAAVYTSPAAAVAAARRDQSRAADLQLTAVRGPGSTKHGWILRSAGVPVVTTARWYESAGEAMAAGRTAVNVFASAQVVDGVSIGTPSGRRSRVLDRTT